MSAVNARLQFLIERRDAGELLITREAAREAKRRGLYSAGTYEFDIQTGLMGHLARLEAAETGRDLADCRDAVWARHREAGAI